MVSVMKRWRGVLVCALALTAMACHGQRPPEAAPAERPPIRTLSEAPGITFEGGDGLSREQAVIIQGAANDEAGIDAEYAWLQARYPGYDWLMQVLDAESLEPSDGLPFYDEIVIETADGQVLHVWFDITLFYGKW
jgi:hypothetical protein